MTNDVTNLRKTKQMWPQPNGALCTMILFMAGFAFHSKNWNESVMYNILYGRSCLLFQRLKKDAVP